MNVLLTGASGSIGTVVVPGLRALGHTVTGLDLPGRGGDVAADCLDAAAVDRVVADLRPDAIVHLAGIPDERGLRTSLESHVVSTAILLDAMVRHDVGRLVYASSNHAVGRTPRTDSLSAEVSGRPDTFYGVGKVAAEAVMRLYVDRYGLDAVSTRIGSFGPRPTSRRQLSTWLSHDDATRMVHAAITAPSPGFAVLYGISANTRAWWDLDAGRALGYDPKDDAEQWAEEIEATPETDQDRAEGAHVGGPFAMSEFERPAVDLPTCPA